MNAEHNNTKADRIMDRFVLPYIEKNKSSIKLLSSTLISFGTTYIMLVSTLINNCINTLLNSDIGINMTKSICKRIIFYRHNLINIRNILNYDDDINKFNIMSIINFKNKIEEIYYDELNTYINNLEQDNSEQDNSEQDNSEQDNSEQDNSEQDNSEK